MALGGRESITKLPLQNINYFNYKQHALNVKHSELSFQLAFVNCIYKMHQHILAVPKKGMLVSGFTETAVCKLWSSHMDSCWSMSQ